MLDEERFGKTLLVKRLKHETEAVKTGHAAVHYQHWTLRLSIQLARIQEEDWLRMQGGNPDFLKELKVLEAISHSIYLQLDALRSQLNVVAMELDRIDANNQAKGTEEA
jgi:hypothetical protein